MPDLAMASFVMAALTIIGGLMYLIGFIALIGVIVVLFKLNKALNIWLENNKNSKPPS